MRVLVATGLTQGARTTDVMECVEGEFVFMIDACDASRRRPFEGCPCGITFTGMTSDGGSTTALVREVPGLTMEQYVDCLEATHLLKRSLGCTCSLDAVGEAWNLVALAGLHPAGTVVERLVDGIRARRTSVVG